MAIYTCATREEIEATLAKLENGSLKAFFKHIVTIEDVSAGKPSPEGYLLAAKYLGVDPKDCLVIEDTQRGANAALAAGMQVAAIATTSRDKTVFRNVTFAADSYSEIDSWLSPATNPIDQ
jgi:beta-phosphoglucomutase